ncbi:hypothetical protein SAMN05421505_10642 [Sinosporangium album]|uniref:ATPase AAA-type core domain-containing protein n=1 Tax=Sinosporangium album TaxID=504805 RepID=A0A1G7VU76_9ACTN|nr:ATP-binding protein [Sinosporangium album]SDG63131.1 hypothetical protein SAMN05421505_10642 [Sinosporangium album]
MLLSFRFANHSSFRDEQQLDLTPENNSIPPNDAIEAVPVAGIFGANASGKSNITSAFRYMRYMATMSDRMSDPGAGVERTHFKLNPELRAEPSRYVADILLKGVRYTYGFTVDDDMVLEEWLYGYPQEQQTVLFERTRQEFRFGEESGRTSMRQVIDITAPNVLFLPVAARANQGPLIPIFTWFRTRLTIVSQLNNFPTLSHNAVSYIEDTEKRGLIVNLLRAADLGLRDIHVIPDNKRDSLDFDIDYLYVDDDTRLRIKRHPSKRLLFSHAGATGEVMLSWAEQSTGTQQLFELAVMAVQALKRGACILVDEIDSSLHPILTAGLIRLFQNPQTNGRGGQLILTTHDSTLLSSLQGDEILHRDQIWFAEKAADGASTLFPLSDFHPRKQENRQRRYLNGSYGAIPNISDELLSRAALSRKDSNEPEVNRQDESQSDLGARERD